MTKFKSNTNQYFKQHRIEERGDTKAVLSTISQLVRNHKTSFLPQISLTQKIDLKL